MFAKDEMGVFPFSPELKLLFQTYLGKLVKKYRGRERVFPVFQVSITQVENDPQLCINIIIMYWKSFNTRSQYFELLRKKL